MSMVHCDEAEPQVLAALHMFSGLVSSPEYLTLVCACVVAQHNKRMQDDNSHVFQMLTWRRLFMIVSATCSPPVVAIVRGIEFCDSVPTVPSQEIARATSIPLNDVGQSPRILIKLPLQLSFLVHDELRRRKKDAVTLVLVFVVDV